jgi:hypothetical protein
MRIGGNHGLAARLVPYFALAAILFSIASIAIPIWRSLPALLDWAYAARLADWLWMAASMSMVGFVVCIGLALFTRDDEP